jgi:hypothetical protein
MNTLKQKYNRQRYDAKIRGIDWQFTFESWINWWGEDIALRGNKTGQLVMARNGDTGPYHPDNVRKITCNQNHSEAHTNGLGWTNGQKHSIETRALISEKCKGRVIIGRKNPLWTEERKAKVKETWAKKLNPST